MREKERSFRTKVMFAAAVLDSVPERVVSLQVREEAPCTDGHQRLVHALGATAGLRLVPVGQDCAAGLHIVESAKAKIIVAEVAQGLEIFYVAGSIASLMGLVPLVLRYWSAVHWLAGGPRVELCRLGDDGSLMEDRGHYLTFPWEHPPQAAKEG